ncbi:hypothetical protein [Dulcicalothrix desertica]|nr:hypothetical protein [Dulcicalothrix desertica]
MTKIKIFLSFIPNPPFNSNRLMVREIFGADYRDCKCHSTVACVAP